MSDMAELFARDPLQHTKESIDEIIAYYRVARANFNLGDKTAGSPKKVAKTAADKQPKIKSLDLNDLLGS